jgi:hypothetical protein
MLTNTTATITTTEFTIENFTKLKTIKITVIITS